MPVPLVLRPMPVPADPEALFAQTRVRGRPPIPLERAVVRAIIRANRRLRALAAGN